MHVMFKNQAPIILHAKRELRIEFMLKVLSLQITNLKTHVQDTIAKHNNLVEFHQVFLMLGFNHSAPYTHVHKFAMFHSHYMVYKMYVDTHSSTFK
jgi:hypothetical protein